MKSNEKKEKLISTTKTKFSELNPLFQKAIQDQYPTEKISAVKSELWQTGNLRTQKFFAIVD